MQNDLKYGKISQLFGINGYSAGKKLKNIAPKIFPCREGNSHMFLWGGGEEFNF